MKAKYVNPFTDFGFKKIFGEEASKPLLLDFLNALLPNIHLKSISFKNTEQLGYHEADRKSIFDIYCENEKGEKFIIELQKAKQDFFKERTIYYSTFPIRAQAEKGPWNFNLSAVFCIGILDFVFEDYGNDPEKNEVIHTIKLKNQDGKVFYDKLTYLYLEMPNFTKGENELSGRLDKWLYFIKHLEDFQAIPEIFRDGVFEMAFDRAALAKLDTEELDSYEYSLKVFRDSINIMDYAKREAVAIGKAQGKAEGKAEGRMEEKMEMAMKLKKKGMTPEDISELTGLSIDELDRL